MNSDQWRRRAEYAEGELSRLCTCHYGSAGNRIDTASDCPVHEPYFRMVDQFGHRMDRPCPCLPRPRSDDDLFALALGTAFALLVVILALLVANT